MLELKITTPKGAILNTRNRYVDSNILVTPALETLVALPTVDGLEYTPRDGYLGFDKVIVAPLAYDSGVMDVTELPKTGSSDEVYRLNTVSLATYENDKVYIGNTSYKIYQTKPEFFKDFIDYGNLVVNDFDFAEYKSFNAITGNELEDKWYDCTRSGACYIADSDRTKITQVIDWGISKLGIDDNNYVLLLRTEINESTSGIFIYGFSNDSLDISDLSNIGVGENYQYVKYVTISNADDLTPGNLTIESIDAAFPVSNFKLTFEGAIISNEFKNVLSQIAPDVTLITDTYSGVYLHEGIYDLSDDDNAIYVTDEDKVYISLNINNDTYLYSISYLLNMSGSEITWAGLTDESRVTDENSIYCIKTYSYYEYKNSTWRRYLLPRNTLDINDNGEVDVTAYEKVNVNLPVSASIRYMFNNELSQEGLVLDNVYSCKCILKHGENYEYCDGIGVYSKGQTSADDSTPRHIVLAYYTIDENGWWSTSSFDYIYDFDDNTWLDDYKDFGIFVYGASSEALEWLDKNANAIIERDITENGVHETYGLINVTVNVPSSGGSGIIEVDELPEVGEGRAIYKISAFSSIGIYYEGEASPDLMALWGASDYSSYYAVDTKPTEDIKETGENGYHWYYVKDENDIFLYGDIEGDGARWYSCAEFSPLAEIDLGLTFKGTISDISQATENGYYAFIDVQYWQYVNDTWAELITPSGTKKITKNGTHDVTRVANVEVSVSANTSYKYITASGTYNASDDGVDGYSTVEVNLSTDKVVAIEMVAGSYYDTYTLSKWRRHGFNYLGAQLTLIYGTGTREVVRLNPTWIYDIDRTITEPCMTSITVKYPVDDDNTIDIKVPIRVTPNYSDTFITKEITANGTYTASDDSADGFSSVTVNVLNGDPIFTEKEITANGTYKASADEADGYSSVTVNVQPTLAEKEITENGTYNASDDSADGYSSVIVNVPPLPTEVAIESEMTALLETAEIGAVYKYTGTSGTYENGTLYIVAEGSE